MEHSEVILTSKRFSMFEPGSVVSVHRWHAGFPFIQIPGSRVPRMLFSYEWRELDQQEMNQHELPDGTIATPEPRERKRDTTKTPAKSDDFRGGETH